VPLIKSVEETKQLIQSAKFPPLGRRGYGSPIAMERFNPVPSFTDYLRHANDTLLTIVQIETKEALDAVEEIAAVDGLDALFIGPFDLGMSLNENALSNPERNHLLIHCTGNNIGHPIYDGVVAQELKDAIAKILAACKAAGKKAGIFCTSGDQARAFADQGFDMCSVATDHTILEFAVNSALKAAKGEAAPSKGGSY
jgi:4-hydroxy-2-oxoheptanedioate aldolase